MRAIALAARIGSVNTIVFGASGPVGYNTDHSGFLAAYRSAFGASAPGRVALIGAGGVGRAIAFALAGLGAARLDVFDSDAAEGSAARPGPCRDERRTLSLPGHRGGSRRRGRRRQRHAGRHEPGTPARRFRRRCSAGRRWAFDAVYTPVETTFKRDAEAAGVKVLSGYALFFHQGIDAFEHFTGRRPVGPATSSTPPADCRHRMNMIADNEPGHATAPAARRRCRADDAVRGRTARCRWQVLADHAKRLLEVGR